MFIKLNRFKTLVNKALFSPASLFASGEQGVWYDPSDLTTMYQENSGVITPATFEQAVVFMIDKSKVYTELVTNGEFTTDTAWTKSSTTIANGVLTFSGSSEASATQASVFVSGNVYELILDITTVTAGTLRILSGTGQPMTNGDFTTSGIKRTILVPTSTGTLFLYTSNGFTGTINSISIKLLTSFADQSLPSKRPVLSARYNLLTRTEQFDNVAWTAGGTTMTGSKTINTTTGVSAYRYIQIASGVSPNTSYTYSIDVLKTTGATTFPGLFLVFFTGGTTSSGGVTINTNTGVLTDRVGAAPTSKSSLDIGTHWRVTLEEVNNTNTIMRFDIYPAVNTDASGTWVSGITGSVTVDRAQLIATNSLLSNAYQRVVTGVAGTSIAAGSSDYDTDPTKFPPYLKFDGVDDAMKTTSVNFSATDKMSIWAGVRKITDTVGALCELTANFNSNSGSYYVITGTDSPISTNGYSSNARGTATAAVNQATFISNVNAPSTDVLAITHNIVGDLSTIRVDTVEGTNGTGDKGFGNFVNDRIYIGGRGEGSPYFNGNLYSLIIRGAASTATQITNTETYVNSKTKAY